MVQEVYLLNLAKCAPGAKLAFIVDRLDTGLTKTTINAYIHTYG